MPTPIDTRVTPSLHPDNVTQIDGYGEDTAAVLEPTMSAFDAAYQGVSAVHNVREKAKSNPTWNEAAQIINTDEYAQDVFKKVARGFDGVHESLKQSIAHIEKELSAPLESKAAYPVASEIRTFARTLSTEKRQKFLQEALNSGDATTMGSILGAPAYLSGMDAKAQSVFIRLWNERQSPELSRRLKAMQGAKELIQKRAGLVIGELEKAVGCSPQKARMLKEAKANAEKAFVR